MIDLVGFLILGILSLAVKLAVENHLRPSVVFFEAANDVIVVVVLRSTWVHECPILEAVVLELTLILVAHFERFQHLVILQLKTCLHCPVLYEAQNLKVQLRILYDAAVATDLLVRDIGLTNVTAVLDFYEVYVNNEAANLYHMSNDLIERHLLKKHNTIVGLEVIHLLNNFADDLEI